MTTVAGTPPVEHARLARHSDQEKLVRHLSTAMRSRLAGADEQGRVLYDKQPREVIVLGVLPPRREPVELPHPELAAEPGVPIDTLPPSEMGVSILLAADDDTLKFTVQCSFALYLQQFPTQAQQLEYLTAGSDDPPPEQDSRKGSKKPKERNVRLRQVYRRYPVEAEFDVSVPVPDGGGMVARHVDAELARAVESAYEQAQREHRLYSPLSGRGQTIEPAIVRAGPDAYDEHLSGRASDPAELVRPSLRFSVTAEPDLDSSKFRVNLTLRNTSEEVEGVRGYHPVLAVFDACFTADVSGGQLENMGYRFADADYRVTPEVYAHGRFCVGEADLTARRVWTTTWPVHVQKVFESREDLQPTFRQLIDDPLGTLETIAAQMDAFVHEWQSFLQRPELADASRHASAAQLQSFQEETRRFRVGIDLLGSGEEGDPRLAAAFQYMNEAFELLNTPGALSPDGPTGDPARIASWYLFQIVFIVCGLGALAAREVPGGHPLLAELEYADVLWFPTGGGKSEAFLGLVATCLFFDRLRDKTAGVSAMIRFPLRMLSVQQLERVLRVIAACEHVRSSRELAGSPFELGYFVGRQNTPNSLTNVNDAKWGDIAKMRRNADESTWATDQIVITACPYCSSEQVRLDPDVDAVRLHHTCPRCDRRLPVVVTDDEVYRTLPAVVVATVDKLATIAYNAHFSHLTHGPASRCPHHGYVTYGRGPADARRCLAGRFCDVEPGEWEQVVFHDPAPALMVQDELHLLSEQLGTFSAHYETLWQHLSAVGSRRPTKVVAATATISDYEHHVRHLYALRPRRFPTEGFTVERSFYAQQRSELTRRLFVGALPFGTTPAETAVMAALAGRDALRQLRAAGPDNVIERLALTHYVSSDQVEELLSRYDMQLFYVNRKTDGDRVGEDLRRPGRQADTAQMNVEVLNGDTPLHEISAVIRRVEQEGPHTPPEERLHGVVGTSLISHGVDLGRVNLMHVAGMTSSVSYYVQATARAGRTDVGLVLVSFGRTFARDRAVYHFFEPHHAYINQVVEPVSVNRFSLQGPDKTASGMMAALLLQQVARDSRWNPEGHNLASMYQFTPWVQGQGIELEEFLVDQLHRAYGLDSPELDPLLRSRFAEIVKQRFTQEWTELRRPSGAQSLQGRFGRRPMTSFRDIDDPVEFGAAGSISRTLFTTLTGGKDPRKDPEEEVAPARETADGA